MTFDVARAEKRVKEMSEGAMLTWLEQAIPGMQRHLEKYQQTRSLDHLGELVIAETQANLVIQEIAERRFGKPEPPVPSVPSEHETDTGTISAPRQSRLARLFGRVPVTTTTTKEQHAEHQGN